MDKGNPKKQTNPFKPFSRTVFWWILIFVAALLIARLATMKNETVLDTLSYNEFLSLVKEGKIANSLFEARTISGKFVEPYRVSFGGKPIEYTAYKLQIPFDDPSLVSKLKDAGVKITAREPQEGWFDIFIKFLPWLLIPLLYFFMLKQLRGGQSGVFNFGKSKAERFNPETNHISFADVAGCTEAKEELMEVVDYLKNPFRFADLGGKAPKGALLLGAPGTGKTLLAKAVATEATSNFISIKGSELKAGMYFYTLTANGKEIDTKKMILTK